MRSYTVHMRPAGGKSGAPVLVCEAFSLWAMIFGPVWLLAKRAWLAALALFCVWLVVLSVRWNGQPIAMLVLIWAQGLFGQDWRRRSLMIGGYDLTFVVVGCDESAALSRLLDEYPGLRSRVAL